MKAYNLSPLEDYFQEWNAPNELAGILRRIAMNYSIASMQSIECVKSELREDLEDLKTFIQILEKTKS